MLVLTRKVDEEICVGHDIRIRVLGVHRNRVRLGITAPDAVRVRRQEQAAPEEGASAAGLEQSGQRVQ